MMKVILPIVMRVLGALFLVVVGGRAVTIAADIPGTFDRVVLTFAGMTTLILGWWFYQSPELFTWAYWDRDEEEKEAANGG